MNFELHTRLILDATREESHATRQLGTHVAMILAYLKEHSQHGAAKGGEAEVELLKQKLNDALAERDRTYAELKRLRTARVEVPEQPRALERSQSMNVKEAIEALSSMPADLEVRIWDADEDDYVPVAEALFEDGGSSVDLLARAESKGSDRGGEGA